jgi:hypothetical protein
VVNLPHLRREIDISEDGKPSFAFHRWMQEIIDKIGTSVTNLEDLVRSIQFAQDAAAEAHKETARILSYPTPTNVLTAADVGTTATITVAAHTRVYPVMGPYDIPDISISSGTITGLAFSTQYFVYYDDETLANVNPTFKATTNAALAQVGAASGRHYLGKITTPADGAGNTTGVGVTPPGGGGENIP